MQLPPPITFSDISGKKALVTGASSGLGVHFAKVLSQQGALVTLAARRLEKTKELAAQIKTDGGVTDALQLDVADPHSVAEALQGRAFDIVINNAGTTLSAVALEHTASDIDTIIDTNLKGVFHVARTTAQAMMDRGEGGTIINIASILGKRVSGHVSAYAASKAGVLQLTRSFALEWARYGIRVNALCPGYIETDLNRDFFASERGQALIKRVPQRRLGHPSDLDGALLLLASDLGQFMTGVDITVDGGHLISAL